MNKTFACFLFALAWSNAVAQTPAPPPSTPAKRQCSVVRLEPTEGERALARRDYKAAADFYTAAIASDGASDEAHLGLTRALIGQNNTTAALAEANVMLSRNPSSALGELAAGEAEYRAAEFDKAYEHYRKGGVNDPCEGRLFAATASLASINALFARAASLLATAHALRPLDEMIQREWIGSLPRQQRLVELSKYLAGPHSFSAAEGRNYTNAEAHLKARRPGECHVSSKTENTQVPFEPIFGDTHGSLRPTAFGLDVLLNGKRRRMQIDSGASGIVLSKSAAKALNLQPEFQYKTGGVGDDGEVDSFATHVASIRIGDVEIADCMVEVLGNSRLDVDGLIGADVFAHWVVTLDYQKTQLILSPLPPRPETHSGSTEVSDGESGPKDRYIAPDMQDWLRTIRIGHNLLLPAQIGNGPQRYLIADTGASQSVLSLVAAREVGKVSEDSSVHFSGVSGQVKKAYHIDNIRLRFGRFEIPPTGYFAFDITSVSHDLGAEVSGFIGLPTLSRLSISIDYRDNLVKMTYDPKHDVQRF